MASKKTQKRIQDRLNIKKPAKSAKKAAEGATRIRKNEQARLYRLNKKFDATNKKGEADKLRREIKALQKDLNGISKVVSDIKARSKSIDAEKKEIKSLKLQNAAITRKLNKKYAQGKKGFDADYKALTNQHIKNTSLIQGRAQKVAALTYQINKDLGFTPKTIAETIDISDKTLEREFSDDFEPDYFEGPGGTKTGADGEEYEEEIIETEQEADEEDAAGFVYENGDVFWSMWKDFESVEMKNVERGEYESVTFHFGGHTSKFKGTSLAFILMKAGEMWRFAGENGSDTYVVKYKSIDGKRIKYSIDEM